jgi:hypothetical protein
MADELRSLQIDTDWKKQAQEEKRLLAEKAAAAKAAAAAAPAPTLPGPAAAAAAGRPGGRKANGERETPEASFNTLVNQLMTQALIYLGEIAYRGGAPMMDLDMARYQHDLLTMLETKSANNLAAEEQKFLDTALHEVRTRFIRAATEYIAF